MGLLKSTHFLLPYSFWRCRPHATSALPESETRLQRMLVEEAPDLPLGQRQVQISYMLPL
jgi:hypothetical protein